MVDGDKKIRVCRWSINKERFNFLNCERIFPTAAWDVDKLVKHYSKDPNVERVIMFGSSVNYSFDCHYSDLDIYLEVDDNKYHNQCPDLDHGCDILYNWDTDYDEPVMNDIRMKGVVVYERDFSR